MRVVLTALVGLLLVEFPGVTAHAEVTIGVSLVVSEPTPVNQGGQLMGPRFLSCDLCTKQEFVSPDGKRVAVLAENSPRVTLHDSEVERVVVAEVKSIIPPFAKTFEVAVIPSQVGVALLRHISRDYPFDQALITLNGKPTYVDGVFVWSSGITVAVFSSPTSAKEFAEQLGKPIAWQPLDEAAWEVEQQRSQTILQEQENKR